MGGSMKHNLMYLHPFTGTWQLAKDLKDGLKTPELPTQEQTVEPQQVEAGNRKVEEARLRQAKKHGRASTILAGNTLGSSAGSSNGAAKRLLGE